MALAYRLKKRPTVPDRGFQEEVELPGALAQVLAEESLRYVGL